MCDKPDKTFAKTFGRKILVMSKQISVKAAKASTSVE